MIPWNGTSGDLPLTLTHVMLWLSMIQPLFSSSKWNMGEIFCLKFHLSCVHSPQMFSLKSLHVETRSFLFTDFIILCKNPPFYKVNEWVQKWVPACSNFENIFSRLFTIIFRPKMVKFHPYSILTNDRLNDGWLLTRSFVC